MSVHLGEVAARSRRHHPGDPFLFHPGVASLEERRMLSAGSLVGPTVPPGAIASYASPSDSAFAASSGQSVAASPSVHSASPIGSQAGPVAGPSVADNAAAANESNGNGTQTTVMGAASSAQTVSFTSSAQTATVVAQLQGAQSALVVAAVPSATGLSTPVPAVVALFAQQSPTSAIPPAAALLTSPFTNTPPKTVALTGGDIPPPAAAPTAPLSPALPPISADLSNEARDQVLQGFARPNPPAAVDAKAIDNLLQDMTDPIVPWLSPSPNLDDGSQLPPADPGIVQASPDGFDRGALGLSLEMPSAQTELGSARWVSLAMAAAAAIGGAKNDRRPASQHSAAMRALLRVERLHV
jgi:hypothetical protein